MTELSLLGRRSTGYPHSVPWPRAWLGLGGWSSEGRRLPCQTLEMKSSFLSGRNLGILVKKGSSYLQAEMEAKG